LSMKIKFGMFQKSASWLFMPTLIILCMLNSKTADAQQGVAVNLTGAAADSSAMLDVSSTSKGILIPRVMLTSVSDVTTVPNPATSLLVYNANPSMLGGAVGFWYFNDSVWVQAIGPQGPQGLQGPQGVPGPAGPPGTESPTTYTQLYVPQTGLANLPSSTWTQLCTVGSFTKNSASSVIEMFFNGHVMATFPGGTSCVAYELRVDGQPGPTVINSFTTISVGTGQIWWTHSGVYQSISMNGYFTGLSAGAHAVQIWVYAQGNYATNVWVNVGSFFDYILIREH